MTPRAAEEYEGGHAHRRHDEGKEQVQVSPGGSQQGQAGDVGCSYGDYDAAYSVGPGVGEFPANQAANCDNQHRKYAGDPSRNGGKRQLHKGSFPKGRAH